MPKVTKFEGITNLLADPNSIFYNLVKSIADTSRQDITHNLTQSTFSNATFSGNFNAIELVISSNLSVISFWGNATQNATGTAGQSFFMETVAQYPLFSRFIGQVDQFAIGYNAGTNDFKYTPIRITDQGMELVTAPNISVGTDFTYQFVLFLVQ